MKDLVQLELIRESLIAVVNEMRANIIHSSYAPIIYEGHDFSCALMSAATVPRTSKKFTPPLILSGAPTSPTSTVPAAP